MKKERGKNTPACKKYIEAPFRWAGGKSELLPTILSHFPRSYNRYIEPFLGCGVVALNLPFRQDNPHYNLLSDLNDEVVNYFQVVYHYHQALIDELGNLEFRGSDPVAKEKYLRAKFYELRMKDAPEKIKQMSPVARAARLHFLQTYNQRGLYRVNRKNGGYNTPWDKSRKNAKLFDPDIIYRQSLRLSYSDVQIKRQDFFTINPLPGDFVYIDPPYYQQFDGYTSKGFSEEMHLEMAKMLKAWTKDGVLWLMSNSPESRKLYDGNNYTILTVSKSKSFNNQSEGVKEILVKNYRTR